MAVHGTGSLVVLVIALLAVLILFQAQVMGKPQQHFNTTKDLRIVDHSSYWDLINPEPAKAKPGDFPWQILIETLEPLSNDEDGKVTCGGSIIYLDWIMTAAHCVAKMKYADSNKKVAAGYDITVKKIWLYAGTTIRSDRSKPHVQTNTYNRKEINNKGKDRMFFIHEEFNKVIKYENDIAIIKLKIPLLPNAYVKPIELAFEFDYDSKKTLTASGWGRMKFTGSVLPDELRYANKMKLLDETQCAEECWQRSGNRAAFSNNMICYGNVYKVEGQGDSGGAVTNQKYDSDPSVHVQVGITSWTYVSRWIHFSTKVSQYRTWIKEITGVDIDNVCNAKECNPFDDSIGQCPGPDPGPDPGPNPDLRIDNMMKCEHGKCYNGRCACEPGYTGLSCTERATRQRWSVKIHACIWLFNTRDTVASTFDNCKILCEKETTFLCRSIDYVPSSGRCVLTIMDSSSGAYRQPCPNGYENTLFTEILVDRYRVFDDMLRNWQQAKDKCASHGLWMAEPLEDEVVYLRKYILEKYGYGAWLNARGDGSLIRWFSSGQAIEASNSLWAPGYWYASRVSSTYFVILLAWTSNWQNYANQPLASWPCSTSAITLCETPAGCPEGFFRLKDSEQCYRFFDDYRRTWSDAKSKCEAHQLTLAEPRDPVALTSYLTTTYGLVYWTWLGARGNGNTLVWQSSGDLLSNDSPYWRPGKPGGVRYKNCAVLQTSPYGLNHYLNTPYTTLWCDYSRQWTLCELPN